MVADHVVEQLVVAGVRHVFGVGGANIEDMFAAVQRRRPAIRVVLAKHEHGAGTAAAGYARVGGRLGVVMTTSGGGAMNLVHAMAEARASKLPVLAIVGEPPSDVQGLGAFQDTSGRGGAVDAAHVFAAAASWCKRAESALEVPRLLNEALEQLARSSGSAVLLIAKDRQRAEIGPYQPAAPSAHARVQIDPAALQAASSWLREGPCVIIAGDEVVRAGARSELEQLASALEAPVAVAPDARDAFDNRHRSFIGVAGAMGHAEVERALGRAQVCVLVGTRLPLLARMGLEARLREMRLVSVGDEPPFVTGRARITVRGDIADVLRRLTAVVERVPDARLEQKLAAPNVPGPVPEPFGQAAVLAAVERAIGRDHVVIVDAGNTGASAVHHLRAPQQGSWLLAMGMAGMGHAFGASIGAAFASGRRCWVIAGDGAFYMHGLEIHTAVEHQLPITYVILNNSAHGMCVVRERLLLHQNAGYNVFRRSHLAAGLASMFPGLCAHDCANGAELETALREAADAPGPSVIGVELDEIEVPPFVAFQQLDPSAKTVSRGADS